MLAAEGKVVRCSDEMRPRRQKGAPAGAERALTVNAKKNLSGLSRRRIVAKLSAQCRYRKKKKMSIAERGERKKGRQRSHKSVRAYPGEGGVGP